MNSRIEYDAIPSFSALGRTVSDVRYSYDLDGNVKTVQDEDNNVTTNTYLGGQLVEAMEVSALGHTVSDTV